MTPSPITAVDILLEPDGTMFQRDQAVNARLLEVFPQDYSLDETHRPHLTTLQRFASSASLKEIYGKARNR